MSTNGWQPCTSWRADVDWLFEPSIIALVGTIFVVLSLSEIASMYPTAGGMETFEAGVASFSDHVD